MTKPEERVFSGIQPTGDIHIGNYLGAIKKWVEIAKTKDAIFCIVDDHAITVDYDPSKLPQLTFEAALTGMACGLDPEECALFVQSHVPEHTELTWLFNTLTPLGSLFRMHQFKDKSRAAFRRALQKKGGGATASMLHQLREVGETAVTLSQKVGADVSQLDPDGTLDEDLVTRLNEGLGELMQHLQVGLGISEALTGLFDYPVLQAADILLYKAALVPVGEDQEQHLELAREVATRFNRKFGQVFPLARRLPGEATKILGLDGKQKMSKSLGNHIGILETKEVIQKKLAGAFTDPQRIRKSDPGRPEICNIFSLHGFFTPEDARAEIGEGCRNATLVYFECKQRLAAGIDAELAPIQERAQALREDRARVVDALEAGAGRCRAIAKETMEEVRAAMGLGKKAMSSFSK
jgi:tryptophanyl-tRNA synthetase